jgi:hypothetical protein
MKFGAPLRITLLTAVLSGALVVVQRLNAPGIELEISKTFQSDPPLPVTVLVGSGKELAIIEGEAKPNERVLLVFAGTCSSCSLNQFNFEAAASDLKSGEILGLVFTSDSKQIKAFFKNLKPAVRSKTVVFQDVEERVSKRLNAYFPYRLALARYNADSLTVSRLLKEGEVFGGFQ